MSEEPKKPSQVTELRRLFESWFVAHHGETYEWNEVEAGKAKSLLKLAGDRGVAEVMRRAAIAGAQTWRDSVITLGVLLKAWNDLATVKRDLKPSNGQPARGASSSGGYSFDAFKADLKAAREAGLIDQAEYDRRIAEARA